MKQQDWKKMDGRGVGDRITWLLEIRRGKKNFFFFLSNDVEVFTNRVQIVPIFQKIVSRFIKFEKYYYTSPVSEIPFYKRFSLL